MKLFGTNFELAQVAKGKKGKKKAGGGAISGEETDGDRTNDEEIRDEQPRRKSRRLTRSHPEQEDTVDEDLALVTPKAKPRPRPVQCGLGGWDGQGEMDIWWNCLASGPALRRITPNQAQPRHPASRSTA